MRIVHVSDLHIRSKYEADQKVILEQFFIDVAKQHEVKPVDIVIFSGDLTFSARVEEFALAEEIFLLPLQNLLGLSRQQMIIGRGNHDNDITRIAEWAEAGLASTLVSQESVNSLLDDEIQLGLATTRRDAWVKWHSEYYAGVAEAVDSPPLATVHRLDVQGTSVGIALLDSAWRATGAPNDADRAKLLIGDRQVKNAEAAVENCAVRIAVSHHPLDWLSEFDRRPLLLSLGKKFKFFLTGHTHQTNLNSIMSVRGGYVHSTSGSLYNSREYINSYNIIDIEPDGESQTIHVRSYFADRDEFGSGENIADGGLIRFSVALSLPSSSQVAISTMQDCSLKHIEDDVRARLVLTPLSEARGVRELLVKPVFLPLPYEQWLATREPGSGSPLEELGIDDEICGSDLPVLIMGESGSGLSSALAWLIESKVALTPDLVPILLSFNNISPGTTGVDRAIRGYLAEVGSAIDSKAPLPPLLLCIDDVTYISNRQRKSFDNLMVYIASRPDDTVFLGSTSGARNQFDSRAKANNLVLKHAYLGPVGRRQLRDFALLADPVRADQILARMTALLTQEGLSRTPFMMATLTSVVLTDEGFFQSGNETAILAGYAENLLGRSRIDEDPRHGMDFRGREDVLGALTASMVEIAQSDMTRNEIEKKFLDYFALLGWNQSASRLIDWLIDHRVLMEIKDAVAFVHPAFIGLFAAKRFNDNSEFKDKILPKFASHPEIVRHASALVRNDKELLIYAQEALKGALGGTSALGELFERSTDAEGWTSDAHADELISRFAPGMRSSEGDPIDDHEEQSETDETDDVFWDLILAMPRRNASQPLDLERMPPLFQFLNLLTLTSSIFRNSELVPDAVLKEKILNDLLGRWADASTLVASEPMLREIVTAGYDRLYPEMTGQSEEARLRERKRSLLVFPIIFCASIMENCLSSRKIETILRSLLRDSTFIDQPGHNLMAVVLASNLRIEGWSKDVRGIIDRHGSRGVIADYLDMMCSLCLMEGDLRQDVVADLEYVLVEIFIGKIVFANNRERDLARAEIQRKVKLKRLAMLHRLPVAVER